MCVPAPRHRHDIGTWQAIGMPTPSPLAPQLQVAFAQYTVCALARAPMGERMRRKVGEGHKNG